MITQKHPVEIVIYGGVNYDIKWFALEGINLRSSSPGIRFESPGGVARNIAENLSHLGVPSCLVSRIGKDHLGQSILEKLLALNIDISFISTSSNFPTAQYCAFFTSNNEHYTGLVDLRIYDELNSDTLSLSVSKNQSAKICLIDTDLSASSIAYLMKNHDGEIWAAVTSAPNAKKISGLLSQIDVLFLNKYELEALLNMEGSIELLCHKIHYDGVKTMVVTDGNRGVYLANAQGVKHFGSEAIKVTDVTGAGDSLLAGTLASYIQGNNMADAIRFGIKVALLTLATKNSVSENITNLKSLLEAI